MKRQFLPYYASRIILSGVFSILVFGPTWKALALAVVLFGLFLLYLHSGWFNIDPANPLFPIRRDERGREAQRKSLIAAFVAGAMTFLALSVIALPAAAVVAAAPAALSLSIVVYFAWQFILLART